MGVGTTHTIQDLGGPALERVAEGADLGHLVALAADEALRNKVRASPTRSVR
jgi:hypothetical protein